MLLFNYSQMLSLVNCLPEIMPERGSSSNEITGNINTDTYIHTGGLQIKSREIYLLEIYINYQKKENPKLVSSSCL